MAQRAINPTYHISFYQWRSRIPTYLLWNIQYEHDSSDSLGTNMSTNVGKALDRFIHIRKETN